MDIDAIWKTYTELGTKAYAIRDLEVAETMFIAARDEAQRLGYSDWRWSTSLANLASVYTLQGKEKTISALYDPNKVHWSKLVERQKAEKLCRLEETAESYMAQGRYTRAINLYQQLIELIQQTCGANHPSLSSRLIRLAWIFCMQKKHKKALETYAWAQSLGSDNMNKLIAEDEIIYHEKIKT